MRPDVDPYKEGMRILRKDGMIPLLKRIFIFTSKEFLLIYHRLVDWVKGRLLTPPFKSIYTQKYHIESSNAEIPEFDFWYRYDSPHVRHRILGEYETEVSEKLLNSWDEETNFWEVGAGWGYHSLSAAQIVNSVVAFDPDTRRTDLLEKSCAENEFENISVVTDEVSSLDDYRDEFSYPDVVLIDTDGWEYDIIPSSPRLLNHGCTWIVELHHDVDAPPAQDSDPKDIEHLFEDYGYTVETIREHYQLQNWRGDRGNSINTHHIIAHHESNTGE